MASGSTTSARHVVLQPVSGSMASGSIKSASDSTAKFSIARHSLHNLLNLELMVSVCMV